MVPEGKFEWLLGVRYTYDHSTGSVKADQESTIDRLLEKYDLTNCNPSKVPMRPDTDLAGLPISPIAEKMSIDLPLCGKSMLALYDKSHQSSLRGPQVYSQISCRSQTFAAHMVCFLSIEDRL
jgi:hypothetical protein